MVQYLHRLGEPSVRSRYVLDVAGGGYDIMVICSKCETKNSVDSAFCKSCGVALEAEAIAAAKAELENLVGEGYKAFNEGRIEEARLIAENVVGQAPDQVNAISLKGMVLEREGKLAEALEAYETIVEKNPDSTLDKIKVQQLRNALTAQALQSPEPNKGRAAMAAVAATVMIVALGVAAAMYMNPNAFKTTNVARGGPTKDPALAGFDAATSMGTTPRTNLTNREPNAPGAIKTETPSSTGSSTQNRPNVSFPSPRNPSGGLPDVGDGGLSGNFRPVQPDVVPIQNPSGNQAGSQASQNPQSPRPEEDIDPEPDGGRKNNTGGTTKTNDPGVIQIDVRNPRANQGGGSSTSEGSGLASIVSKANELMMAGRHDDAAKQFERALGMGGDAGQLNQRLGQCYQNLGRKSDAIQAYQRAISVLEGRVQRGGSPRAQSQLDACRQALRLLQG